MKVADPRRKTRLPRYGSRTPGRGSEPASVPEPSICSLCGAVYAHRVWRAHELARKVPISGANHVVCPACRRTLDGAGRGHVTVRGDMSGRLDEIRRRIRNVAARARFTQPERRLISMEMVSGELYIVTTSQRLAHRIAKEIAKAFRARTIYAWSDRTGELQAVCELV